ncbi:unnamed protein product [Coregonus sp. 'balchen']|nr:unnamed protein product [Coregonus sp. 'balchen']
MDVELKLEADERDMPISPAVIKADLFDTQAGYEYDIDPHETTSQQICGILSKDSVARDVEIKAESIGLTTIGAQDREITDNVLVPSINSLSQAVGVKRVILNTTVEGRNVIVRTEQDNPSTSVKDKSCFEIPPSDTQIGKVFRATLSQSPLSVAECASSGGQIKPTEQAKKTKWQFFVNASKKINLEHCSKVGVDFDVGSGGKQKLDLKLLTNGVMIEISDLAKYFRTSQHVICDILEYNFDLCLQSDQRSEFAIRTNQKVKYLMTLTKSKLQKPGLLTQVFELPMTMTVSKTHHSCVKHSNDIVSANQRLKKDFEIQQLVIKEEEEECVPISSFEEDGLVEYEKAHDDNNVSLINFDLDASQASPHHVKKTMSNETDVPQSAVETATLGLKNGPTDICMKDEPNEDLITTQDVKMETISIDTDVSLSDEEAGHRPRKIQYVMTSTTEDKMKDLYPLCKEISLDLDVKSKGRKGECELLKERFSMAPHWKRSGISNVTKERPLDYKREKKIRETLIARKMQADTWERARQVPQSIKTESVFTETSRFADETAILGHENRSADIFIKEESDRQSGVIEQASDSENNQVNVCWTYIHKILTCKKVHGRRCIFSKLENCFNVQIGSDNNFKPILARYRSDVLPLIVEEYDSFSHAEKTMMSLVNQLLCGLHLIDGLAHQANTTLLLWENIILGEKEVGVYSSPDIGPTELESGTMRLGNTVRDAVQEQRWGMDGYLVPFTTFLASKGEFEEVPLSPSSGNRIDGLFHNAAGVYSIHDDIIAFTRDYEDESSMLAAVAAGLEVQPFKAGCRALGLIFKIIIDPLWRALTLKENVLDMEVRYQTLVTKLKQWQEDARDLVEGNVRLFDDIEVPKDLVFDRLTMWTDPDFFQLTVQIVELLLASFLRVCCKMLLIDLQQVSKINDRCRKDLEIIEQLQKAKANSISIAVEAMGMCKTNHTWEWLSFLDAPKIVSVLKALQIV